MTLHPSAVVATVLVMGLTTAATWVIRRRLRARRGGPPRNDSAEWSTIFFSCLAVFGLLGWLVVHGLDPLGR